MPILDPDDTPRPAPQPAVREVASPDYRGITVDTRDEPVENLLTHVEGSSWTTQYFSQVLNIDSQTAGQNQSVSGVFQQYTEITNMELKVSSPLSSSQDPQTKQMQLRGTAVVYPFVIPNTGDMFLADIGGGREGIFQVTSSVRKSTFERPVHEIEYVLVNYEITSKLADLRSKVVRKLYYERDFLQHGQNPLLFEEEYEIVKFLRRNYRDLIAKYFRQFYSREFATLLMPGQKPAVYDPYLVAGCLSFFDTWDTDEIQKVKAYNVDEDDALRSWNIYSVLKHRDLGMLTGAFVDYGTVQTTTFSIDPTMYSIRHSGLGSVIYPMDPLLTVDYVQYPNPRIPDAADLSPAPQVLKPSVYNNLPTAVKRLADQFSNVVLNGFNAADSDGNEIDYPEPPPLINKAMDDGAYVFSRAFYANDTSPGKQSQLELQVRKYLKGEEVEMRYLKMIVEDMINWSSMDRFYLVPILLVLIKARIRSI